MSTGATSPPPPAGEDPKTQGHPPAVGRGWPDAAVEAFRAFGKFGPVALALIGIFFAYYKLNEQANTKLREAQDKLESAYVSAAKIHGQLLGSVQESLKINTALDAQVKKKRADLIKLQDDLAETEQATKDALKSRESIKTSLDKKTLELKEKNEQIGLLLAELDKKNSEIAKKNDSLRELTKQIVGLQAKLSSSAAGAAAGAPPPAPVKAAQEIIASYADNPAIGASKLHDLVGVPEQELLAAIEAAKDKYAFWDVIEDPKGKEPTAYVGVKAVDADSYRGVLTIEVEKDKSGGQPRVIYVDDPYDRIFLARIPNQSNWNKTRVVTVAADNAGKIWFGDILDYPSSRWSPASVIPVSMAEEEEKVTVRPVMNKETDLPVTDIAALPEKFPRAYEFMKSDKNSDRLGRPAVNIAMYERAKTFSAAAFPIPATVAANDSLRIAFVKLIEAAVKRDPAGLRYLEDGTNKELYGHVAAIALRRDAEVISMGLDFQFSTGVALNKLQSQALSGSPDQLAAVGTAAGSDKSGKAVLESKAAAAQSNVAKLGSLLTYAQVTIKYKYRESGTESKIAKLSFRATDDLQGWLLSGIEEKGETPPSLSTY